VSSPLPRWSLFAAAGVVLWVGRAGAQDQIIKPTTISATDRLPPPATVKAAQQPDGRIRVVWNAVEGASKYTLTRSVPNVGMGVISRPNPSDTMYLDSDVTKGAYYYYLVNAVGANGMTGLKIGAAPVLATISVTAAPDTSPTGGTGATGSGSTGGDTASAASETRAQMLQRAYNEGEKRFPNYKAASQTRWLALADKSGMSYDQLVAAWDGIFVVDYAYENLLQRQPTGDEVKKYASAAAGTNWQSFWREIATSAERDQKFGYYAPAPFSNSSEAAAKFGLKSAANPEQCFGGVGDKCEGGIPLAYSEVQPRWLKYFTLPDGTQMGIMEVGVAVGSILHDNACLANRSGLNCNGIGPGDLVKTGSYPAGMEWNKAAWNVLDTRNWRERFGPYPINKDARRGSWYDDLRPMPSREAWMAPVLSMFTLPSQTERYTGGETKASRRLKAAAWRTLDGKDQQFCASGTFRQRGETPLKAPWGICQ
jgi:hypothetical protein